MTFVLSKKPGVVDPECVTGVAPMTFAEWVALYPARRVESAPEQPWYTTRDREDAEKAAENLELFHGFAVEVLEYDGIYYVEPKA